MIDKIDPVKVLSTALGKIEKPARYLGGENLSIIKEDASFRVLLCFPDMYEIGMCNNAMRILYSAINQIPGIACERYFLPASDFEDLIKSKNLPAWSLESGTPLYSFDMIAFTVGYELLATNILHTLHLGQVPLYCNERDDTHPLIIAGGPAISNPIPFQDFLDGIWIGEAENEFFNILKKLNALKAQGASKKDLLKELNKSEAFWTPGKKARRAFFSDFPSHFYGYNYPVPVTQPVQEHGVVEIMRGCPNNCRFCHAGIFYRPQRYRDTAIIFREVDELVNKSGIKEISLNSLSSGDYPAISELVDSLNSKYGKRGVSFQLPSLKIESFSLDILEKLSATRKSGLTFAVETPVEQWQMIINKKVTIEKIVSILDEAEKSGYKVAKFYFMIGLPVNESIIDEADAIIDFVENLINGTKLRINLTLATFVPKPHTAFQWCRQLTVEESFDKIFRIRDSLRKYKTIKISYHAPYLSYLEGLISRGDRKSGELIYRAWQNGARFDAWDDKFNKEAWENALKEIEDFKPDVLLGEKELSANLPWDEIDILSDIEYLKAEYRTAMKPEFGHSCSSDCENPCGICNTEHSIVDYLIQADTNLDAIKEYGLGDELSSGGKNQLPSTAEREKRIRKRLLLSFTKTGKAAWYPHHGVHRSIASGIERAGLLLEYTEGFNPQPRLEISEPLMLGIESQDEYALVILDDNSMNPDKKTVDAVNKRLPEGLKITDYLELIPLEDRKFPSLSSLYSGTLFELDFTFSKIDISDFTDRVGNIIAHTIGLENSWLNPIDEKSIQLFLPFTGKRELNLQSLFEKASGESLRESDTRVKRIRQEASFNNTKSTYREAYGLFSGEPSINQ